MSDDTFFPIVIIITFLAFSCFVGYGCQKGYRLDHAKDCYKETKSEKCWEY